MAFFPLSHFLEFFLTIIGLYLLTTEQVISTPERLAVFIQRMIATSILVSALILFLFPQLYIVESSGIMTTSTIGISTSILRLIIPAYISLPLYAVAKLVLSLYDLLKSGLRSKSK